MRRVLEYLGDLLLLVLKWKPPSTTGVNLQILNSSFYDYLN